MRFPPFPTLTYPAALSWGVTPSRKSSLNDFHVNLSVHSRSLMGLAQCSIISSDNTSLVLVTSLNNPQKDR